MPISDKKLLAIGRVLSGLAILFLALDAGGKLIAPATMIATTPPLGIPPDIALYRTLGAILAIATALYAWPRTALLGAVLLTGYLGGAIGINVRAMMPLATNTLFGVYVALFVWGGLYLRSPALRAVFNGRQESEMTYVDGFVTPTKPGMDRETYAAFATRMADIIKEHGALRVVEAWGDDVPDGDVTDFRRAVKAEEGETVCFSWIEWPDKATRDAGMAKAMEDPRMQSDDMPFVGKRLIYGGFAAIVER